MRTATDHYKHDLESFGGPEPINVSHGETGRSNEPAEATYCRCCDTDKLRQAHGPTLEAVDHGVQCTRCGLEAVDAQDAAENVPPMSPARQVVIMGRDAERGAHVDLIDLARMTARALIDDDDGPVRLLAEIAYEATRPANRPGGPFIAEPFNPWRDEPSATVAEMTLAAMAAIGLVVEDVLGDRAVVTMNANELLDVCTPGPDRARAIGRWAAFGRPHDDRAAALRSVLADVLDAIRVDRELAPSDGASVAAILAALAGAGFAVREVRHG